MARIRLVDSQGNPVVAEEADLQGVLEEGLAGFGPEVELVGADGGRYRAAADKVPELVRTGDARLATDEELAREEELDRADEGLVANAAAQSMALMRGATFGLSDRVADATGFMDRATIQTLAEANEDETGGAEFFGGVIPSLALGAATGGSSFLGTGVLRKAASQALIQGGAGSADAAARVVNDDWLNDQEISAERVLAGAGAGFALGAAFGAAGELAVPALQKASEKAARALSPQRQAELTVDAVTGGYAKAEKGLALRGFDSDEGRKQLGEILQSEGILGKTSEESYRNAQAALDRIGGDLGAVYRRVDEQGVQLNLQELRKALFEIPKQLEGIAPDIANQVSSRVRGLADQIYNTKPVSDALESMRGSEGWADAVENVGVRKAQIRFEKIAKLDPMEHNIAEKLAADEVIAKTFPQEIEAIKEAYNQAGSRELSVSELWELRKKFDELRQTFDVTNSPARKAVLDARDNFQKVFFEDLAQQTPELAEQIGLLGRRYQAVKVADDGLELQARALRKAAGDFGLGGVGLGMGLGAALGPGSVAGGIFGGLAGRSGQAYARDAARQLAPKIVQAAAKAERRFASFVDRLVGVSKTEKAEAVGAVARTVPRAITNSQIDERRQALEEAAAEGSPAHAAALEADPVVGPVLATQQANVAKYLLGKLPAGKDPVRDIWARFEGPHYSDADRRQYARIERAAFEPMAVLEEIIRGKARPEEIQTVQDLYPRLMERARRQLTVAVAQMPERPTSRRRDAIERFLGMPQSPAYKTWLQDVATRSQAKQPQAGAPGAAPTSQPTPASSLDSYGGYGGVSDRLQGGIGQS